MRGMVEYFQPRVRWGRITGEDDATYFFCRKWVVEKFQGYQFRRGVDVTFDPERTAKGRVAFRVSPSLHSAKQ